MLGEVLKGIGSALDRHNNFDALRLVAAISVIFSHAFFIGEGTQDPEPLMRLTDGQTILGVVGVFVFFIISGYLVTQSFEMTRSAPRFALKRALRIYPGLFVCLALSAFVLGPLLTELPIGDYVRDPGSYLYALSNFAMITPTRSLPGVYFTAWDATSVVDKIAALIENLDSIVSTASKIFNNESQRNIAESFRQISLTLINLEKISGDLNEVTSNQKKNLSSTITNINDVTANLKVNTVKLGNIMDNFSNFSDSLVKLEVNKTVNHLNTSITNLQSILSKIDTANGTIGKLVNDPLLYQNLTNTSDNLNRLLVDFRLNPKRYVHFSAIDLGREVNVSTSASHQTSENLIFRIQLLSSPSPINLQSPQFKGIDNVSEVKLGDKYYYLTEPESSYDKVRFILNKIQSAFPEAILKPYKNGKEISLKIALKMMKN